MVDNGFSPFMLALWVILFTIMGGWRILGLG